MVAAPLLFDPQLKVVWTEDQCPLPLIIYNLGLPTGARKHSCTYTTSSEKAMAPHSSILAWKIPWAEEPGRLQSMGSLRVGHDWTTSLSLFTFMHWRRKWQPTPVSCLENPRDGGAWWAAVYGVAQSRTRLKRLSSSRYDLIAPHMLKGRKKIPEGFCPYEKVQRVKLYTTCH